MKQRPLFITMFRKIETVCDTIVQLKTLQFDLGDELTLEESQHINEMIRLLEERRKKNK